MSTSFQLALYQPSGEPRHVPAADFLRSREAGTATWQPDLENTTFLFDQGGRRFIASDWNLGPVEWLVPQLDAAAERLEHSELALVRSAVTDGVGVPYLAFEPSGEDVAVSLFVSPDPAMEAIFPAGPWSEQRDTLYQYFRDHRDMLLQRGLDPALRELVGDRYFSDVRVDRRELIAALRREAELGRRLLALAGR
jgi:hypothetical protein